MMNQNDSAEIAETLVGHAIVSVDEDNSSLTLDNGTVLTITPNQGCWSCASGNYRLDVLNHVENVITAVELDDVSIPHGRYSDLKHVYKIFVYTGGVEGKADEKNVLLEIYGDDGNGFYGTGYQINVS